MAGLTTDYTFEDFMRAWRLPEQLPSSNSSLYGLVLPLISHANSSSTPPLDPQRFTPLQTSSIPPSVLQYINPTPNSYGQISYANGARYNGNIQNGLPHGQGTMTFPDGGVCSGVFQNGRLEGLGQQRYADGTVYEGSFLNGLANGEGKMSFPNGTSYTGQFLDGKFNGRIIREDGQIYLYENGIPHQGFGSLTDNNGITHKGYFQNGQLNGKGTATLPDGTCYDGIFQNGRPHGYITCNKDKNTGFFQKYYLYQNGVLYSGHGSFKYPDGRIFTGNLQNGLPNGQGKMTMDPALFHNEWDPGARYMQEGNFKDGLLEGEGREYSDGLYSGPFHEGLRHGNGTHTDSKGLTIQGQFVRGVMVGTDASELGKIRFFNRLYGLEGGEGLDGENLGVMVDVLQQNGSASHSEQLRNAHMRLQSDNPQEEAQKIYSALNNGESELLVYGMINHDMGLNLIPDGDFVICEIFNSEGYNGYHPLSPDGEKSQTMLRVRVPRKSLTPDKICRFLNFRKFRTYKEAYGAILDLPGAVIQKQTPGEEIRQTHQQSGNCTLEWIFAYLINKMPRHEYNEMRRQLFERSFKEAMNNPDPQIDKLLAVEETRNRILRRLERRGIAIPSNGDNKLATERLKKLRQQQQDNDRYNGIKRSKHQWPNSGGLVRRKLKHFSPAK